MNLLSRLLAFSRSKGWYAAPRFCACVWLALSSASFSFGGDESIRTTFLQQYQPHAQSIQDYYTNVDVDYISTSYGQNGKNQVSHVKGKYNLRNYLLREERGKFVDKTGKTLSRFGESIECCNSFYSFMLYPKPENNYVLADLKIGDAANSPLICPLSVPYADRWEKRTYLEMAQNEKTQVLAFTDCTWQHRTMKELKCRIAGVHPQTKKPIEWISCYYFLPESGWICCGMKSYSVKGPDPKFHEWIYTYEAKKGEPFPTLKRIDDWDRNTRDPTQSRHIREAEIVEFRHSPTPFPDSDFMLSAFGLPEPMGVPQPPPQPRTWLWLLAAAVGAGLLAILFLWLKRRHAAASHAKT